MFARINEIGVVVEFPVFEGMLRKRFPGVSMPAKISVAPAGYVKVIDAAFPQHDPETETVVEDGIKKMGDEYIRSWKVIPVEKAAE